MIAAGGSRANATCGTVWLIRLALALCLLAIPCATSRAQWFGESHSAPQSDEDEDNPYAPGLIARFRDAQGEAAARRVDGLSHVWNADPPDERLAPGPFSATFSGRLWVQTPGQYRLRAYATGEVSLTVNGQQILKAASDDAGWLTAEPIELPFGFHPLEVEYRSKGEQARIGLYWEGPNFGFEPLASRWLLHEREQSPDDDFQRGKLLVRGLRCGACHEVPDESASLSAPALVSLKDNLSRAWLVDWLSRPGDDPEQRTGRRMPHFAYSREQAEAMAGALLAASEPPPRQVEQYTPVAKSAKKDKKKKNEPEPPPPSAELGGTLFRSIGCLACHRAGELGTDGLFGGGDLSQIAGKRPPQYFAQWLAAPARLNPDHRMPGFPLTADQRASLSLYLQTLGEPRAETEPSPATGVDGVALIRQAGCSSCHKLPQSLAVERTSPKIPLVHSALERDQDTCLAEPAGGRPGFRLSEDYRRAIRTYLKQVRTKTSDRSAADLLTENNCLACHARGIESGIGRHLPAIAEQDPSLAEILAGLQPPALHGIGDKLTDEALAASLDAPDPPRRPWLSVRMPKFKLRSEETAAIVAHFVEVDRIPPRDDSTLLAQDAALPPAALDAAGPRLVTADGFGCTSCHAIGKWEPQKVALNAHGTALSNVGSRVRREWFDRWVRNPARIVPQMEMPSVQQPIRGVLDEQLDDQLAAVWRVLNRPDFTPPAPNALRVVRRLNLPDQKESAAVLTDVIEVGSKGFIKPLVIGIDNRHNVLFDLATARLAAWWIGDTARQQTRGKTWFWEAGMPQLLPVEHDEKTPSDLSLVFVSSVYSATRGMHGDVPRQFVTEFDSFEHVPGGVKINYRLRFGGFDNRGQTQVVERYEALPANADGRSGFRRTVSVEGSAAGLAWRLYVLPADAIVALGGRSATLAGPGGEVEVVLPEDAPAEERLTPAAKGVVVTRVVPSSVVLEYRSQAEPDAFPLLPALNRQLEKQTLAVVPGYEALRLPTTNEAMPTAMAFDREGTLFLTSLEGRVWRGRDTDGDELIDDLQPFADDLAAPYGLQIVESGRRNILDVINKYAVLRLHDEDGDGRAERTETIASGWGHTRDYHDWAIGLPRDTDGNYYVALPCEQDGRSEAAAYLRGHALKLVPRQPTDDNPRRFAIEDYCAGLRFPQGLLMTPRGELLATDNQGNYNPFNELNRLEPGQRYGFINSLEAKRGLNPPSRPAAVEIPHPWTRSVNGLGFAPPPFRGDLLGCEYDTRRLVRISLDRIGQELQGAVYPFSREPVGGEPTFEGPLSVATAPTGDVYIGNIRDSGWGAGSNTGSIVRLRQGENVSGIAWVKHQPGGFRIRFTGAVDEHAAADPANYSVSSYRRISTPAYGGEDVDRRVEKLASLQVVGGDAILKFDELRDGFVYEFHLRNLNGGREFFPAEAYYTLRHQMPEQK